MSIYQKKVQISNKHMNTQMNRHYRDPQNKYKKCLLYSTRLPDTITHLYIYVSQFKYLSPFTLTHQYSLFSTGQKHRANQFLSAKSGFVICLLVKICFIKSACKNETIFFKFLVVSLSFVKTFLYNNNVVSICALWNPFF